MNLNNNPTFQIVFFSGTVIAVLIALASMYVLRRKRINIYKKHRILKISLCILPVVLLPVFFHPKLLPFMKVKIAILGVVAAIATYIVVDKGGKRFRAFWGYETKWDREEKELEEKEKQNNQSNL